MLHNHIAQQAILLLYIFLIFKFLERSLENKSGNNSNNNNNSGHSDAQGLATDCLPLIHFSIGRGERLSNQLRCNLQRVRRVLEET